MMEIGIRLISKPQFFLEKVMIRTMIACAGFVRVGIASKIGMKHGDVWGLSLGDHFRL
jgi:hypothetical protein